MIISRGSQTLLCEGSSSFAAWFYNMDAHLVLYVIYPWDSVYH